MTTTAPPRKRRWLAPVIVLGVLLLLVLAAFLVAEKLARDYAADLVSAPIKQALGIPADKAVDVDFGAGSFLLQALSGSIDEVTISVDDATVGPTAGDATLVANDVPLDTAGTIGALTARVSLDGPALLALAPNLGAAKLSLADGAIRADTTVDALGQSLPVTLTLQPAAVEGQLTLAVIAMTVNGEAVDVAAVQAGSYGPAAAALVTPQSLCVAQYLPASLQLTKASVVETQLVIAFSGSAVPLSTSALATKGTCP